MGDTVAQARLLAGLQLSVKIKVGLRWWPGGLKSYSKSILPLASDVELPSENLMASLWLQQWADWGRHIFCALDEIHLILIRISLIIDWVVSKEISLCRSGHLLEKCNKGMHKAIQL